jgi:hypothetical protein
VAQLFLPERPSARSTRLAELAQICTDAARARFSLQAAFRHRLLDLAPPNRRKLTGKLEAWHELDFAGLRDAVKKAFHVEIPVRERGEWEAWLAQNSAQVHRLSDEIAAAEREIDAIVYQLFDLTGGEIALVESSLSGQS